MSSPEEYGGNGDPQGYTPSGSYALSGKIMLSAIVVLFTVVFLIVCLHIYARWCFLRDSSRHHPPRRYRRRRRRVRHAHMVFSIETVGTSANSVASRGLDESVLKSLPIFVYMSATHGAGGALECAVCLSEFEDDEKGRLLPKCNHSFHIDCIDMWFQSHSTCPLCRTPVTSEIPTAVPSNGIPVDFAVTVAEPETGSSSGLCPSCRHDEGETGSSSASSSSSPPLSNSTASSSLGTREKTLEAVTISIEVPRRGLDEDQLRLGSPSFQGLKSPGGLQGLRSPGGRIQSWKRIFRNSLSSPSSATSLNCSTTADIDLENGDEHLQPQPKK